MTLTLLGMASMAFVIAFTWHQYVSADPGVGQSRQASLVEAWSNIVIGFSINFTANIWLVPLMADGGHMSHSANWWGGWVYTSISMLRQYAVRRFFNTHIHRFATWAGNAIFQRH